MLEVDKALTEGELYRIDVGSGDNALVFVHGFSCNADDWIPQLDALADRYRCVAVDLPGHGRSSKNARPTVESIAACVIREIERLDLGTVVLFGHSFGSRAIGEIYRQAPHLVRALVYVDGSIQQAASATAARDFERQVEKAGFEKILDALYDDFFVASSPDNVRRMIFSRRAEIDATFHLPLCVDMIAWDAAHGEEVIRSIKVPCLVIQSSSVGANMRRTAIEPGLDTPLMALVREAVPNARIDIVRDVGHFPMLEAPARTNAIIEEFLAGI